MFDNLDDPKQQMLLAMGLGLLGGKSSNFGNNLSQAGLLGLSTYNQGQQRKARLEEEAQQKKMRDMQMAQMQRAQEDQAYAAQLAPQFFGAGNAPSDGMGPVAPPKADFAGYGQALMARNPQMGMPFIQAGAKQGPQYKEVGGRLVAIQDGKVSEAYAPPDKPVHQPGQTREIKSGRRIITQEYDGSGWKTLSTSLMDKPESASGPAAPQGYRWAGDKLEPIPGGPADEKAGAKADAVAKRQQGALARADLVLSKVGDAIDKVGPLSTGAFGQATRRFGNSPAFNLERTIDPIKANIGFAELQAMREASPTGGALGQVAVQELNMLQSVLGSLDTGQGQEELLKTLNSIHKHFTNWKQAVKQARTQEEGVVQAAPKVGTTDGEYYFKGGDPSKPENWVKRK